MGAWEVIIFEDDADTSNMFPLKTLCNALSEFCINISKSLETVSIVACICTVIHNLSQHEALFGKIVS